MNQDARFDKTVELVSRLMDTLIRLGVIYLDTLYGMDEASEVEFPSVMWFDKGKTLRELCKDFRLAESDEEDFVRNYLGKTMDDLFFDANLKSLDMELFAGDRTESRFTAGDHGFKRSSLPYVWSVQRDTGITIRDVTEGCYGLKGSKSRFWDSLFVLIRPCEFTGNHAIIEINFEN